MKIAPFLVAAALFVPGAMPASAQEACESWHALMQQDEGGPVMTASACAIGRSDAWLLLQCSGRDIGVRYDLAAGAETSAPLNEVTEVHFSSDAGDATLSMTYEDMDGRHAGTTSTGGALVSLFRKGSRVTVSDTAGRYPERNFSLEGSAAAIDKLIGTCR